jgi:hypothetical protein
MQTAVMLLEPIHDAQRAAVLGSRGQSGGRDADQGRGGGAGQDEGGVLWPIYGEHDEICFLYYPDRSAKNVADALGLKPPDGAVLLTDGYAAYTHYARKVGLTHAQCWAHSRRAFFEARDIEPQRSEHAIALIGELYAIEADIRDRGLTGEAKRAERQRRSRPQVGEFLAWVDEQFDSQGFLPSSPLTKALAYVRERREGLQVYLDDPDVPIDTNHLERALRTIPMGRKAWLLLDRAGRQARGHRAEPADDVQAARGRSVRLSGRRAAACRPAPGQPRRGTDTAALENTLRRQSAALATTRDRRPPEELRVVTGYAPTGQCLNVTRQRIQALPKAL